MKHLRIVLGNQLFDLKYQGEADLFFLREDSELATYFRFHKHKIVLFFAAMRSFRDELVSAGYKVVYQSMNEVPGTYEDCLVRLIKKEKVTKVSLFEVEDKFFESRLLGCLEKQGVEVEVLPSPMFLCSRQEFSNYLKQTKRPFMKTFYQRERVRQKILLTKTGGPLGGKWSFDEENRKALPKEIQIPKVPAVSISKNLKDVISLVEGEFPDHPGDARNFWLPVDRKGAKLWLKDFLVHRFDRFGPYEDALSREEPFLFHSVLTPFLNLGLLTPQEVVEAALDYGEKKEIPMASLEGFLRQIMGWREFIRGIYQNFSEEQEKKNFFKAQARLRPCWYSGGTGIPPLDDVIAKVNRYAYSHHIERLMVVGSLMTLLQVKPQEAHRWFMEMYLDSSDWVMGPNVYGMALFSDGGIFATKPYICGSKYYRKMGKYPSGPWTDEVDGLYWKFIHDHKQFFGKNPRLSMIVRTLDKMKSDRKATLFAAAEAITKRLVIS